MAATISRFCGAGLLKSGNGVSRQQISNLSTAARTWTKGQKRLIASVGAVAGGAGALLFALDQSVQADGAGVHPTKMPWSHDGVIASFDHASLRRGYEVYKTVCAACHSMQYIAYRNLVGVTHTEEQAKAEAEGVMIKDGPDDQGNYYERPGKLSDYFPSPYPNEEAARAANNGAYPPDLSYIVSARHGGENYIFALLTGYTDPPAGVILRDGQHFNPYFPGGAIGMAQVVYNEVVDFEDGTPASAAQIAKDVATFLRWCSEPEMEDRKRMVIKAFGMFSLLIALSYYVKRHKWAALKSRKIFYTPKEKK